MSTVQLYLDCTLVVASASVLANVHHEDNLIRARRERHAGIIKALCNNMKKGTDIRKARSGENMCNAARQPRFFNGITGHSVSTVC